MRFMFEHIRAIAARLTLSFGMRTPPPPIVPCQKLQDVSIIIKQNHECKGHLTNKDRDLVGESRVHDKDPDKE